MIKLVVLAAGLVLIGTQGMQMMEPKLGGKTANQIFDDDNVAQLAKAACAGDVARIAALIAKGADINAKGLDGAVPLFFALKCEQPAALEAMLQAGADPNLAADDGITGTYAAASYADPVYLRLMLKYEGNPTVSLPDGFTALYEAYAVGQYRGIWDNFYLLLDAGVDVNLPTRGVGMADFAVAVGHPSKAVDLLEKGYSYKLEALADAIYGNPMNVVTAEHPEPLREEPEYKYLTIAAHMLKARGVDTEKIKRRVDERDKRVGAGIRHDYSFEDAVPEQP